MKNTRRILFLLMVLSLLSVLTPGALPTASATICDVHTPTRQVTQEPTCIDYGYYINVCAVCGAPLDNGGVIPPLGHDFRNDWSEMYPATCESGGMEIRFCHRCQQEEVRSTPALGHNWVEQTIDRQEPTCTENGYRYYVRVCSRCGAYDSGDGTSNVMQQVLPALGHDWGNWRQEYPGTCVQKEMRVRTCRRCGLEQYVYGDLGDHDWGPWTVVIPAGPGVPGLEERVCKIESSHRETRDIPALPKLEAELTIHLDARDYFDIDTPKTDFYEGEAGWFYGEVENTGEVPLEIYDYDFTYTPGDTTYGRNISGLKKVLQPGEKTAYVGDAYWFISAGMTFDAYHVNLIKAAGKETETLIGTMTYSVKVRGYEPGTDNVLCEAEKDCTMNLLKPPPEPALTLTYVGVSPDKEVYDPEDVLKIQYEVENTGNVPLRVLVWTDEYYDGKDFPGFVKVSESLQPGEKKTYVRDQGASAQRYIKPGTATAELLGIDEVIATAYGYDPDSEYTGKKEEALCASNTIAKEYKVARAEPGTYILKGVTTDYAGAMPGAGGKIYPTGGSLYSYVWADKSGILAPAVSCLYLDAATTQPLTETPKKGETYYFALRLNNGFGEGDHSIDFTQIDPALVNVTMDGFTVTFTGAYPGSSGEVDYARLYFSATCEKTDGPSLTLTYLYDGNGSKNPYPASQDTFDPDDEVFARGELVNSGSVLLEVVCYFKSEGVKEEPYEWGLYGPDDTDITGWGWWTISDGITPGTETAELMGTVTVSYYYVGYDPDTYVNSYNPGTELCRTETITRTWKVRKEGVTTDGELKPELTLTASWAPDEGEGKCYLNAPIQFTLTTTNTGNCPVNMEFNNPKLISVVGPGGPVSLPGDVDLQPNESVDWTVIDPADAYEVEHERYWEYWFSEGYYTDADGERKYVNSNNAEVDIPLTYPEDGDPEPDNPALEIKWTSDNIHDASADLWYHTTAPGVLKAEDDAWAQFDVINVGNVPLKVVTYATWANGKPDDYAPWYLSNLAPGESDWDEYGASPLGDWITPGTDTAELLGTVTVTYWAKGFDPDTDEELCETEHLSRTWEVAKPGPTTWPIPEESNLAVSIGEFDSSIDPAGYQLFEYWDTRIGVYNTGTVTVDEYTLHVDVTADNSAFIDWTNIDATDGATWYEKTFSDGIAPAEVDDQYYWSPDGFVAPGDVTRGYVQASAYVTWIDPDSGNPRQSNVASVSLPVISATGLLLQKGYEKPANESYFLENEEIKWTLTIKNTTEEPIYNVVVEDEGFVVATFPVLNPGQEEPITVPGHVVTDYDVDVVGYVLNQAFATGDDLQGIPHIYPSNVVKAPCNEIVIPPPPPPPEDPGKKKDDPPEEPKIEAKPGDACKLSLTALSDSEARYTLHACEEHLAAAQAAQAATANSPSAGWDQAAAIWRAEIDKLYDGLRESAIDDNAKAAVTADQEAYWAFIDAWAAMNGESPAAQKALAETLRLRCAELCCMLHTAPDELPDSLLGDYASMMNALAAEETSRSFGRLNGNDCDVTVKLDADLAAIMGNVLSVVRGSKSDYAAQAFVTAQAQWQMSLDSATNAAYRAADRDGKKLIAAWRQALDQVIAARREMLSALYNGRDDIIEERIMNLYRDAAIDARIVK